MDNDGQWQDSNGIINRAPAVRYMLSLEAKKTEIIMDTRNLVRMWQNN